jgi:hypothetical protein
VRTPAPAREPGVSPLARALAWLSAVARSPHAALSAAVVVALVCERARGGAPLDVSWAWPVTQGCVAAAALALAWRSQDRLRLPVVLVLGCALELGLFLIHSHLHNPGDYDSVVLYPSQGNALLHGHYPRSEYPPGAVGIFALEAWVSGGTTRTANALLMVPFQLLTVAAIWRLRTNWSAWFATLVALWPLNGFFWEFRFDLVPTAALAVGLALAWRERWLAAGAVLGLGAAVKWTPALSALVFVLWLAASGRRRLAGIHAAAFALAFLIVNLPFVAWQPSEVLAAYGRQGGRGITGESAPYLILRLFGHAHPAYYFWDAAKVPSWADGVAVAVQLLLTAALLVAAVLVRGEHTGAVVLAALAPTLFLLTNRVFSPQFFVLLLASWAVAGALICASRRQQLAVGIVALAASLANTLLFPTLAAPVPQFRDWTLYSLAVFITGFAVTVWLVAEVRPFRTGRGRSARPRRRAAAAGATSSGGG